MVRRPVEAVQYHDTERLNDVGIEPSFHSVGDSYDKALAETINGLFKANPPPRTNAQL